MNFANRNEIEEYLRRLKREPHNPERSYNKVFFGRIDIPPFHYEIMAGNTASCEPNREFDYLGWYKKVSLHLYEIVKEQQHALSPNQDDRFKGFSWLKYFTYETGKGAIKSSYMGQMVPMDEVVTLTRDLYKVSRLKIFF